MPRLAPLLVFAAAALLAACDSGPAVDPPSPADIAGVYDVQEFRFTPDAGALDPAVLLDTLVAADTRLEVLDGGDALFRYRFRGGVQRVLQGEVEVRAEEVRLTFDGGADRTSLLLPERLVLTRAGTALAAAEETRANLEAYDRSEYRGFTDVPGVLALRLALRSEA